jgi:PAS domain S-box-containing protein
MRPAAALWLPLAATLLGLLAAVLVWQGLLAQQERLQHALLRNSGNAVARAARDGIEERLGTLERMAQRWGQSSERDRKQFELEATVIREGFPCVRTVGWAGPDRVVRWVSPLPGSARVLDVDVNREPVRRTVYDRAEAADHAALSPPLELRQGGRGLLAVAAVRRDGALAGFVYLVLNPALLFSQEIGGIAPDFPTRLSAAGQPVFERAIPAAPPGAVVPFHDGELEWAVEVWPSAATLSAGNIPDTALVMGAGMAALLGLVLRAALQALASRAALAGSEQRLRSALERAPLPAFVHRAGGEVLQVNRAMIEAAGYPGSAARTVRDWARLICEEYRGTDPSLRDARFPADYRPRDGEADVITVGGERRVWDFRTSSLGEDEGGCPLYMTMAADVTERIRSQQALRRALEELRELTETLDLAPVLIRDLDDHIRHWNRGVQALYGWTAAEATGRLSHELLRTRLPLPLAELRARLMADGHWQGELRHFRRDGRPIVVHSQWVLHSDATGEPRSVIEVNTDITRLKAAEEALRELNAELEDRVAERTRALADANAELESFAHSVAHDLRAPLRAMRGFSQALQEDYGTQLDETGQDYARRVADGAARMDDLINDLLAYSRLSREELALEPLALDEVVTAVRAQLSATLAEARAALTVAGPLPRVRAHRAVLVQVLANLVANAAKFVRPDVRPQIAVRAERTAGRVRLWVEDNGIGIAPEHQQRIFQVFQRLHGMREYPGTGIGLAIVRRGVERMGGQAGVCSEPGHGSRFWIDLEGAHGAEADPAGRGRPQRPDVDPPRLQQGEARQSAADRR